MSQNKFAHGIGVSAASLSEYLNLKYSMPLSVFQNVKGKLRLEDIDGYVSVKISNAEIHRKLALGNINFMSKKNAFKKGDPRTREIAVLGGKIGGIKGGPKVAKMLMQEHRGIFSKDQLNKRSFYAKKGGKAVVERQLGPFSPDYYKLDQDGCQSDAERIVYNHIRLFDKDVISINKNPKYWFKCGERILKLDFYLPHYDIFLEVCGCLGDPRYSDKAERLKLILDYNPNIRIILIVNDIQLAKEELKAIIYSKQILKIISLDEIRTLILDSGKPSNQRLPNVA